jgi:hypothetical protein
MNKYLFICLSFCLLLPVILPAQEALKSIEEEYYDFLALQGLTERPALNYRTLSDSIWAVDESAEHPWQDNNLGVFHPLFGDFRMRVYGPDLFMSGNTAAPYGQNDGVLWQGRGFNALFKSGVRFEGYGVELTLLPHFAFSQNADFEIMPSMYDSEYGYFWGYGHNVGIDAPQRFGGEPFFDWDFGDSEIRYTWKTLTIGFGTQAIWLGPAYLNPILHSNNAPAYPKFDIGLRRQKVIIPGLDWYAGDVEARLWVGRLSESDYFDEDDINNYTMLHGLSFAYAPSFLPGLTLFANRVCLVPWELENMKYIILNNDNTIEDQKASFGFSWVFPQVGFEVYGEMGIDDFVAGGIIGFIRRPFHTTVYSFGLKKTLPIMPSRKIYGELLFEYDWMEKTMEYAVRPYSFYAHHQMTHGYTNKGQWLGNSVSPIGNAQSLRFTMYYPNGNSSLMISRNNPNTHYIYENEFAAGNGQINVFHNAYLANFNIDLSTRYFFTKNFLFMGGVIYNLIINPNYRRIDNDEPSDDTFTHNFSFQLGIKVNI